MGVVVAGGQVDSGNAKLRSDKGNVGEGAKSRLESLACDVIFKVGIVAIIEDGVIGTATVDFYEKLE